MRCLEKTFLNVLFGTYEDPISSTEYNLRCIDDNSLTDDYTECDNGFLDLVMDSARIIVSLMLTLAISLLGILIILGQGLDIKRIAYFVFMIALVGYFAIGEGWQDGYFNALISFANDFASILLNAASYQSVTGITIPDGCQLDTANGIYPNDITYQYDDTRYAAWDMFDCKMASFFGTNQLSITGGYNILNIVGPPGGLHLLLVFSILGFIVLLVIFLFILMSYKLLYAGIVSFIGIILLVFLSPFIIPMVLFPQIKAVRGLFDNWLNKLISFSIAPFVIFGLMAIILTTFDFALFGKEGDVLNRNGEFVEECNERYMPCILNNLKNGDYMAGAFDFSLGITNQGSPVGQWFRFSNAFIAKFGFALFYLMIYFGAVAMIIILVQSSLLISIFNLTDIDDSDTQNLVKLAGRGARISGAFAYGGFQRAKSVMGRANRLRRGKTGDYGT